MTKNLRYYTAPVPKMPPGLIELMDGLARDVLKHNPSDIYEFCSDHMKKLLEIRDGSDEKAISKVKQTKSLEQKIEIAKKIIGERAALRREEYDKNMQISSVQAEDIKAEDSTVADTDEDADAEQYVKDNIIKIDEVDFSGNAEHEIAVPHFKSNDVRPLLKEQKDDNCIVDIVNVGVNKDLSKDEMQVVVNKTEFVPNDEGVPGDFYLKTDDENNTDISIIKRENNTEPEAIIIADEIEKEGNYVKSEFINNETENNDSTDDSIHATEVVALTVLNEEHKDNEEAKIKIVEELEDKMDTFPDNTDKELHKINQNGEIEDKKVVSLDSMNNVQSVDLKNNEIAFNENENVNNEELLESENELSHKCLSIIDDNVDENKGIMEQSSDSANALDNKEKSFVIEDKADEDNINQPLDGTELSQKRQTSEIGDKVNEDKGNYQKLVNEVNNTSMDLETAAITIQKVFRSFLFRNKTLSVDEATNVDINLLIEDKDQKNDDEILSGNPNKERRVLGLNRIDTVLQTVNEEKSLSLSTDDSSTLSSAATIIQAHVRGFLVRNKFNFNKANSSTSGFDSDGHSTTSFEADNDKRKNKTVLNIHIVPEGSHFMSRDESMLTSIDLSVDGSPRDSNLHPMGYDTSERRKQLKREDAIQSISPPSNNSGKQSVEVDSVKEILEQETQQINQNESNHILDSNTLKRNESNDKLSAIDKNNIENVEAGPIKLDASDSSLPSLTSDEMDVVTPFAATDSDSESKIMHSGEFHDVVLPTKVSRSDNSVVRGE